jgi:hypothetical protein
MPSPSYYVDNATAEIVASLYGQAEDALKVIERTHEKLCIPTVNQLRYAGNHLSKYLLDPQQEELTKAANHCKRAIYDAYEAGIYYFLSEIKSFQGDYKHVVITEVLKDWVEVQQKINQIKSFVASPESFKKEDRFRDCHGYFDDLRDILDKLEAARGELNKKIRKERRTTLGIIIAACGLIIAFLAYMGLGGRFSKHTASANPPTPTATVQTQPERNHPSVK